MALKVRKKLEILNFDKLEALASGNLD